jgi:NADPH-dependent 2,4-dienoyl-CoA reductase/sulfur reductase-like enzyme
MSKERLVVIGGNAAGMTAAAQARRRRADLEIVVLERGPYVSYAA